VFLAGVNKFCYKFSNTAISYTYELLAKQSSVYRPDNIFIWHTAFKGMHVCCHTFGGQSTFFQESIQKREGGACIYSCIVFTSETYSRTHTSLVRRFPFWNASFCKILQPGLVRNCGCANLNHAVAKTFHLTLHSDFVKWMWEQATADFYSMKGFSWCRLTWVWEFVENVFDLMKFWPM
jgi:hypothetical protein